MKTRISRTIALMRRRWITALESAQAGGVLSLSQRVSLDLQHRYKVLRRWRELPTGGRVMEYRIVA